MTNGEFKQALLDLDWTHARAAQELGISLRTVSRYVAGERGTIPRTVELVLQTALARRRKR